MGIVPSPIWLGTPPSAAVVGKAVDRLSGCGAISRIACSASNLGGQRRLPRLASGLYIPATLKRLLSGCRVWLRECLVWILRKAFPGRPSRHCARWMLMMRMGPRRPLHRLHRASLCFASHRRKLEAIGDCEDLLLLLDPDLLADSYQPRSLAKAFPADHNPT